MAVAAEVQTQAAVDDSHRDECPTKCNVGLGPETRLALADVHRVVEEAEDGLDGEENDDDDAENGVVVVDLVDLWLVKVSMDRDHVPLWTRDTNLSVWLQSNIHAQSKSGQSHEVGKSLRRSMDPDQSRKGEKSD